MEFLHKPVLFEEAIDALALRPDGIYIDGTGRRRWTFGGHLPAFKDRNALSIDQDPDAIAVVTQRLGKYPGSVIRKRTFVKWLLWRKAVGLPRQMGFCWTLEYLPISWTRRSEGSLTTMMHPWICG